MAAFNEESYRNEDNQYRTDEINYGRFSSVATPDPEDDDLLDDDDELDADADTVGDDPELDDDELDDVDLDDADLDEDDDLDDDDRITGHVNPDLSSGIQASYDDDDDVNPEPELSPNETPEEGEASEEKADYPSEGTTEPGANESDTSWSEQIDVTPPASHEFPSEGHAKTDFESRPHGRTTGRMVGDDPGTEGI